MPSQLRRAQHIAVSQFPATGTPAEQLTFLLSSAILAPSSHNTQPWLFRIDGEMLILSADDTRALPIVDPYKRELTISCGAALAHLQIALRRFGYAGEITLLPELEHPEAFALVRMGPPQAPTADEQRLYAAIPQRHTNRRHFTDRLVAEDLLADLQVIAQECGAWLQIVQEADERTRIGDLIAEGDRIQWADPAFRRELAAWSRFNGSHRRDGIPGYAQEISALASLVSPYVMRAFDLGKGQATKDRALAAGAPVLAVLGTETDTPQDWLIAGQALARVLLRAWADGVAASFFNQPIEAQSLRPQLQEMLGRSGTPQILLRLGYGPPTRPTPRRPVSEALRSAETLTRRPPVKHIGRRRALVSAGVGTLVLIAGGTVWRAADQGVFSTGQGPAYAPWGDWHAPSSGPLNLVRAAILAANPHNTQPWLFRVTDTRIDLFADTNRKIGLADPFLSELHIGLGCALENLLLTAPANGYVPHVTLFPDPTEATLVARVELAQGPTTTSTLYQAIPQRHTNRYPYDMQRPLAQATLDALSALNTDQTAQVFWVTDAASRHRLGDLIVEAAHAFVADIPLNTDDNRWYRATWQDVQRYRDGITLDASGNSDFTRFLGKMLPPLSLDQQNSYFLQGVQTQVQTAGVLGILAVRDKRDNVQRMGAGRLWQRMHLWATTQEVGMQPLNQLTEMTDREIVLNRSPHFGEALRDLVADPTWQALMTFRAGYPTHVALLSPRRPINQVVKS